MATLLIFEDYPYEIENRLFRLNLRQQLKGRHVETLEEKTVRGFERIMQSGRPDILILDVMAVSVEQLVRCDTSQPVPDDMTGVELLRRCRLGRYGTKYSSIPIFMRTARGEVDIRLYCENLGATGYFKAGGEDQKLIEAIQSTIGNGKQIY